MNRLDNGVTANERKFTFTLRLNCAVNPFVFGAKTNREWFAAWFGALQRVLRSLCLQPVHTS